MLSPGGGGERVPMSHRHDLTKRERQAARLVAAGLTNREIAERLGVETATAKTHVSNVLSKMGVESREEVRELPEPGIKQPVALSDDDVVEILWGIHALMLRRGSPELAKIVNRALLHIRLHRNGNEQ